MQVLRYLKYVYLTHFSQPVIDRALIRAIHTLRPKNLVQIGIGNGGRTHRALEIALWHHLPSELRFVGIDPFESRPSPGGLTLKQAHAGLKPTGIKLQLVPGDVLMALSRIANSLPGNDLVLISADQDGAALKRSWYLFPRILHPGSTVMLEQTGGWQTLSFTAVQHLAESSSRDLRRAA